MEDADLREQRGRGQEKDRPAPQARRDVSPPSNALAQAYAAELAAQQAEDERLMRRGTMDFCIADSMFPLLPPTMDRRGHPGPVGKAIALIICMFLLLCNTICGGSLQSIVHHPSDIVLGRARGAATTPRATTPRGGVHPQDDPKVQPHADENHPDAPTVPPHMTPSHAIDFASDFLANRHEQSILLEASSD